MVIMFDYGLIIFFFISALSVLSVISVLSANYLIIIENDIKITALWMCYAQHYVQRLGY